jgi:hypothetical protein
VPPMAVFCNVISCHWARSYWRFNGLHCLQSVQNHDVTFQSMEISETMLWEPQIVFYGPEIEGKLLWLKTDCEASDLIFFGDSFARRFQNTKI